MRYGRYNQSLKILGAPVMYGPAQTPDEIGAGYGYQDAETKPETDIFYYHSDHLGSTSHITDDEGNATQYVCYMPYGETLVDEHTTAPDPAYLTAYKFNGKEMDAETGLYYYGARYYEPELAMWYGVDALAEKYASMGGYVYCAGNPVKLIDPDGNDWDEGSQKYVSSLEKKISEKIKKTEARIEKQKQKGKDTSNLENQLNDLNTSLSDIKVLADDKNHVYSFEDVDGSGRHLVRKGDKTNSVVIEKSSDGFAVHEMAHIRQSLKNGGLNFNLEGYLNNSGNSNRMAAQNEIEAYRLQFSYGGLSQIGDQYVSSRSSIDIDLLGNIKDDNNHYVYPAIHTIYLQIQQQNSINKKILKANKKK